MFLFDRGMLGSIRPLGSPDAGGGGAPAGAGGQLASRVITDRRAREARTVRFQDVDAAGVIFYARVFEYFHDAYVSFLTESGSPLPEVLRDGAWAAPIRHAEADYYRPMRFGDEIEVAIVAAHLEATELTLGYQIRRVHTLEVTATGQTVHTFVDPITFQRREIPEPLRSAFAHLRVERE